MDRAIHTQGFVKWRSDGNQCHPMRVPEIIGLPEWLRLGGLCTARQSAAKRVQDGFCRQAGSVSQCAYVPNVHLAGIRWQAPAAPTLSACCQSAAEWAPLPDMGELKGSGH